MKPVGSVPLRFRLKGHGAPSRPVLAARVVSMARRGDDDWRPPRREPRDYNDRGPSGPRDPDREPRTGGGDSDRFGRGDRGDRGDRGGGRFRSDRAERGGGEGAYRQDRGRDGYGAPSRYGPPRGGSEDSRGGMGGGSRYDDYGGGMGRYPPREGRGEGAGRPARRTFLEGEEEDILTGRPIGPARSPSPAPGGRGSPSGYRDRDFGAPRPDRPDRIDDELGSRRGLAGSPDLAADGIARPKSPRVPFAGEPMLPTWNGPKAPRTNARGERYDRMPRGPTGAPEPIRSRYPAREKEKGMDPGLARDKASLAIPIVRTAEAEDGSAGAGGGWFFSSKTFKDIGASEEVVKALESLGLRRPSHVQAAAYRTLASGARHVVVADHAGSGKTLAYLLPVLQSLRDEERALGAKATAAKMPRAVVITPTAELAKQVLRVCRALSRSGLPHRSLALTGDRPHSSQKDALKEGVDLVVATPGRLREHIENGNLSLESCKGLVFDEADILLGDQAMFREEVLPMKAKCGQGCRFIFVTATIPQRVFDELSGDFPGMAGAVGPNLHRTPAGLEERLVDCSGGDEISEESGFLRKAEAMIQEIRNANARRVVVFCNKLETCRHVENYLVRRADELVRDASVADHVEVLPLHGAIRDDLQERNLSLFLTPPADEFDRRVLVCTDRASRGVDTSHVGHVVLFDFPRDPSEYVRRVGRTARGAGGKGIVSILVLGRQVPLAKEIVERNQKGMPLHKVPAIASAASAGFVKVDSAPLQPLQGHGTGSAPAAGSEDASAESGAAGGTTISSSGTADESESAAAGSQA